MRTEHIIRAGRLNAVSEQRRSRCVHTVNHGRYAAACAFNNHTGKPGVVITANFA